MFSCLSILGKLVFIVALAVGLLTQFFPCCAFAIRSFSKVSATPALSQAVWFVMMAELKFCQTRSQAVWFVKMTSKSSVKPISSSLICQKGQQKFCHKPSSEDKNILYTQQRKKKQHNIPSMHSCMTLKRKNPKTKQNIHMHLFTIPFSLSESLHGAIKKFYHISHKVLSHIT